MKKWFIHMNWLVAAPALLVLSRALWLPYDCSEREEEEIIICSGKLQRYNCIYTTIYLYLGLKNSQCL